MSGDKKIFISALVFAVIIFLFGLLLGNYIVTSKMDEVRLSEESFIIDLLGMEMQDEISDEHFCELDVEKSLRKKMVLGKMLATLEERMGKENEDIIRKKEIYELIQIKIIKYLEKMKNECNRSTNILIYFYTNKENDIMGSVDDCNDESKIIENVVYDINERIKKNKSGVMYDNMNNSMYDNMNNSMNNSMYDNMNNNRYGNIDNNRYSNMDNNRYGNIDNNRYSNMDNNRYGNMDNNTNNNTEYKSNIYVFAFDANSENLATYALLKKYEIKKVPAIIINGKKYGYLSKEDLIGILEKELSINYASK